MLNSITEKYKESLAKDNDNNHQAKILQGPNLRPIVSDRKAFWETPEKKAINGKLCLNGGTQSLSSLKERKGFWDKLNQKAGNQEDEKVIRTFQNRKVEDLTKVWHDIVSDTNQHQQKKGQRHQPFEKFLSRVNVAEMSDKYERKKRENEIVEENETNINREGQLEKSQKWEETLSKQIPEEKIHKMSKETDVELLCKAIYDNGEQYMDGTGAINFMDLKVAFRGSGNIINAITKAKKFGIVDHDGEQAYALESDDVIVLQVPVFKVVQAFNEMRERHPDLCSE